MRSGSQVFHMLLNGQDPLAEVSSRASRGGKAEDAAGAAGAKPAQTEAAAAFSRTAGALAADPAGIEALVVQLESEASARAKLAADVGEIKATLAQVVAMLGARPSETNLVAAP
jgi:hypothetical protein